MLAPDSSYSALVIHWSLKVEHEDKYDPPIHTENFLSGGATTLIFISIDDGARLVTSLLNLSRIPGNMVVPPDMTMFL